MKNIDFSNLSKNEIINKLNLKQEKKDFTGSEHPKGVEVWAGKRDTEKAEYHYTLTNLFEWGECRDFCLIVQRYSKTATVYSSLFGAYIPRKTQQTYIIKA